MNKKQAQQLLEISGDECGECGGRFEVVEGVVNIGNFFLRCNGCGEEYE